MLKKIFRRVRKGIRDVGSFAKDHSGIANPELALMALTLGASGIMPGGKPFGLETLFGNLGKVGNIGRNFNRLANLLKNEHVADAFSIAICHSIINNSKTKII